MMWMLFGLTIGNLNKPILLIRFREESIIVECWYCSVINEQYFPTWKHNIAVNSLENIRHKSCAVIRENILNIFLFLANHLQTHWEVITVFILFFMVVTTLWAAVTVFSWNHSIPKIIPVNWSPIFLPHVYS